jgi:hypothetical protein
VRTNNYDYFSEIRKRVCALCSIESHLDCTTEFDAFVASSKFRTIPCQRKLLQHIVLYVVVKWQQYRKVLFFYVMEVSCQMNVIFQQPIMTTPKDILISAYLLIKTHGNAAEEYATKRMWELQQLQNVEGAAAWRSIIQAIKEVRNTNSSGYLH